MIVKQHQLSGILYMVAGIFLLSTMDAMAKWLVKETLDPLQLIAIRSWFVIVMMFGYFTLIKRRVQLQPTRPVAQMVRGMFGVLAPYCFFTSLKTLPLADATVIFFSSTFMITALSWPLLRERVGVHRWSAVVIGFIGVLIAMRPEGGGKIVSYMYCLVGSLTYSLLFISGRWLSRTETVASLVFSFNLALAVVCTLLLPLVWVPVSSTIVMMIFVFSLLALSGHLCITSAFSKAAVGVIAPFEYTALVWAVLLGYLVWQDIPGWNVVTGAAIIILCGLYVIYRESRQQAEAPVTEPLTLRE